MKTPLRPPPLDQLLKIFTPARLLQSQMAVRGPMVDGEYPHWDDLCHRRPPDGLTREEWWFGLKMQRRPAREIPLLGSDGQPFTYRLPEPILKSLHQIDLQGTGAVATIESVLDPLTKPETRKRYLLRSLVEEAITSSQLEGAVATREDAREMIRANRSPRDQGELMILNNFLALRMLAELRDRPLSKELVVEIHRLVTKDTLEDPSAAARLREDDDHRVIGDALGEVYYRPPPASRLEQSMAAMCAFANGETPEGFIHPAVRSMLLHFWLAYDHPFVDGNGRTARALFYWSMLRHHYWLFEFLSISRIIVREPARYGLAFLKTETDDNDLTYFLIYHAQVIQRAIDELYDYIRRRGQELRALDATLPAMAKLNYRQRDLIRHALRHPELPYTIAAHQASHGVAYDTARTDLQDLEARGLMLRQKQGKALAFIPAADLGEKLRQAE